MLLQTRSHTLSTPSCTAASLATRLAQVRMACGFVPLVPYSNSEASNCRETVSGFRVQTSSIASLHALSHIFVASVLPPSVRSLDSSSLTSSLALVSTCVISGEHTVEMCLSISMWNPSVCASISLCDADSEWLSEVASALRQLDERIVHAFAFKTAIHAVLNPSSSSINKDAATQFLEQTSGSCLLQLSKPTNSDRLVFALPHNSISGAILVEALSTELQSRFHAYLSKTTFASKIDESHIGVILLSHTSEHIHVDTVILPEQDSSEPNDSSIGDVPHILAELLSPDEAEKSSIAPDTLLPALKDWLRNVISLCDRTLANAAFRSAHQTACMAPEIIDSVSLLKVLGLAQCISIDITFADLLSVNESTATSLFGSVSLFQSLSPEHIQRVQHAIADAISDHRATDAMLSFCSATSADGVYAMNIKQQALSFLSRRSSTMSTSSAPLLIETSGIDDSQSVLSPSSNSNSASLLDASESLIASTGADYMIPHNSTPPESALMFVRIGRLTSDGEMLCLHLK